MARNSSMGAESKALCFTFWFRGHNNPRYAALFPQLEPVVQFRKIIFSRRRIVRAIQFRLWKLLSQRLIYPVAARYFSRRYSTVLAIDTRQIPAWPPSQKVIVDMDDPVFSATEFEVLKLPQVKGIVVTTEKAKAIYRQQGITCPIHVIPQGVSVEQIDSERVRQIRGRFRQDDDIVIGYHAPTLTLASDGPRRARGGQDDLDFLFAAFESARKTDRRMKLWLIGEPSASVKQYVREGGGAWITLFGYVPLADVPNYISNFDIGVYPRTWAQPPGRFNVKLAQFMAWGVPVVATDLDETFILREAGCGIVCKSQEDFSRALIALAQSAEKRASLGTAGRTYARMNLDWSLLLPAYRKILAA